MSRSVLLLLTMRIVSHLKSLLYHLHIAKFGIRFPSYIRFHSHTHYQTLSRSRQIVKGQEFFSICIIYITIQKLNVLSKKSFFQKAGLVVVNNSW